MSSLLTIFVVTFFLRSFSIFPNLIRSLVYHEVI